MKIVLALFVAAFVFAATVLGAIAATGNLNQEAFQKMMGKEVVPAGGAAPEKPSADSLGTLADGLRQREETLAQKERELAERESQLDARQKTLETQAAELKTLMQQIDGNLAQAEQERQAQVRAQALSVAGMDAENAAAVLEGMPIDNAAAIMLEVKEKTRGEILNAMKPEVATSIIQALQDIRPAKPAAETTTP